MNTIRKILGIGPVFIIIAALLWSMDGILRRSLYSLPPEVVVFYEHILGAIILLPLFIPRLKELKTMTRKEWISIGLVSLFSGALGTIFYTAALGMVAYIQFSVVVLLQQLQPIWAIAAAALLLKEKLTGSFLKWAAVAIIAAYFVTFRDLHLNLTPGNPTLIAALLALAAGMMWAVSTSFSKMVLQKISYWSATSLRFWLAPIFAFAIAGYQGHMQSFTALTSAQWITLLGITLSTGMVALVIYYYGLRKTPARVSTICELVWPGSAIFIDYFLYKQTFSITQIIGVGLLLLSIYHVSKLRK